MTNNDKTITTIKSVMKTVFGMSPEELKELKTYRSGELQSTYDTSKVINNLVNRLSYSDKYDFNNLIDHLEAVESIVNDEDRDQSLRKVITIRTDDFQALVEQATDTIAAEQHANFLNMEREEQQERNAEKLDDNMRSISWNLNRIATHLEKDSHSRRTETTDNHEKLMRKNTLDLLRGKS
jgi:hypothetical protein